jgi:hypothetical protein
MAGMGMKFTVNGTKYEIEFDSLTLDEGDGKTTLGEFTQALKETRVRALRVLVLIAKRRAGETVEWADLGGIDLMELAASIIVDNDIDLSAAATNVEQAAQLGDFIARHKATQARPNTRKR